MKVLSPSHMGYNLQPLKMKVVGSHGSGSIYKPQIGHEWKGSGTTRSLGDLRSPWLL